jgi:hypothetical protein
MEVLRFSGADVFGKPLLMAKRIKPNASQPSF